MNAPTPHLKPAKLKRCRYCKQQFIPSRPMQSVCDWQCGHALVEKRKADADAKAAKADRKETRAKLEKLKTRRDWINEAQRAFNSFVRQRDIQRPCICCGLPLGGEMVGGAFDCGHYRSIGSAPGLRFDERNAHAQRKQCNRWGAGRAVDYRIGLIQRIGLEAVEALEADNQPRKWAIDELKAIRDLYRAKLKELKANH